MVYCFRMAITKKKKTEREREDWWECRENTLCSVGGKVNWCGYYRKQYGGSFKTLTRNTIWSITLTWVILLKEIKTASQRYICTPMFILALFTIAKIWKQPENLSVHWYIMNKENMTLYIYIIYIYIKQLFSYKKGNSAICEDVGGPWNHYA